MDNERRKPQTIKMHTEQDSLYDNLESMQAHEILEGINKEDQKVAKAVQAAIPQIEKAVIQIVKKLKEGGRLFYMGAGTSGRLGIVDASECPPTYGVPHDMVVGIIAGGDGAIRKAVEFAEDNTAQGWKDLQGHHISKNDFVVGITASGRTPYVLGVLQACNSQGIANACIVCNENSSIAQEAMFPIEVLTGPEFVTGSTRMKAGTAQKLVLNMLTTSTMVLLGKVKGNKMVDMQLSNQKLIERGVKMILEKTNMDSTLAKNKLLELGSVRKVLEWFEKN